MTRLQAKKIVRTTPRYLVLLVRAYRRAPEESETALPAHEIAKVWHKLQPDHVARGKLCDALITLEPGAYWPSPNGRD